MTFIYFLIFCGARSLIFVCVCVFTNSKRAEDWEESIFVRHKECGFRLKDNVHFHMYISTSPCGDGRLNSPYEISTERKTTTTAYFLFQSPSSIMCNLFPLTAFCNGTHLWKYFNKLQLLLEKAPIGRHRLSIERLMAAGTEYEKEKHKQSKWRQRETGKNIGGDKRSKIGAKCLRSALNFRLV